ncbi:MAG: response regulator [Deltaproteobacteria bacterium]|nr:response regulator [Deltaproteobacteria bacterium]
MTTPLSSPRVLFVDDEKAILKMLGVAFSREPWDIGFASSGQEALAKFDAEGPYDVVVSDQKMPGMTGVELLRILRRRSPLTARIILSGYAEVESILDAVNEGFVYKFLIKTSKLSVIQHTIREVVEAAQLRRENHRLVAELEAQQAEVSAAEALAAELDSSDFAWLGVDLARSALDAMPAGVVVLGKDDRVLLVNAEACRLLGAGSSSDLLGRVCDPRELSDRADLLMRQASIETPSGWSGTVHVLWTGR